MSYKYSSVDSCKDNIMLGLKFELHTLHFFIFKISELQSLNYFTKNIYHFIYYDN